MKNMNCGNKHGQSDKRSLKEKFASKIQNGKDWVVTNKYTIIKFAPVAISVLTLITKGVSKQILLRKQEGLKDLYCYDRSLGHYWRLRRNLTNKEWVEIDRRKQKGERLADILSEIKVLK